LINLLASLSSAVVQARLWLFMLELIEGNVTDEEKEMRTLSVKEKS